MKEDKWYCNQSKQTAKEKNDFLMKIVMQFGLVVYPPLSRNQFLHYSAIRLGVEDESHP